MRQTLDNAGTPLATASYDPWGTPQGSLISPFGFTGEIQDAAGLTYLRARWYNASIGYFTSIDKWEGDGSEPQTLHKYTYTHNDPVNFTDPSGKWRFANNTGRPSERVEHIIIEEHYIGGYIGNPRTAHAEFTLTPTDDLKCFLEEMFPSAFPDKGRKYRNKGSAPAPWKASLFNTDIINSDSGEVFEIKPDLDYAIAQGMIQVQIDVAALNFAGQAGQLEGDVPYTGIMPSTYVAPFGTTYSWNDVIWWPGVFYPKRVYIGERPSEYQIWAGYKAPGLIVYWYEQTEKQKELTPKDRIARSQLVREQGHIPSDSTGRTGRKPRPQPEPAPPLPEPGIPIPPIPIPLIP